MIKIVAVAIVVSVLIVYLKSVNSELYSVALVGAGVLLIVSGLEYLSETLDFFDKLSDISGLDKNCFSIIMKITGIAYVIEFGAGIIEDFGLKSMADKVIFVGKTVILATALPLINQVFGLFMGLIK